MGLGGRQTRRGSWECSSRGGRVSPGHRSTPDTLSGRAGKQGLGGSNSGKALELGSSGLGGPYIHREKRGPERGSLGIRQQRRRMRPEPRSWCPASWKGQRAPPWMPNLDAQPAGHTRAPAARQRGFPGKLTNAVGSQGTCGKQVCSPDSVLGADQVAPRCPCSPFLPPGPGAAELQVAGRCHGGRASSAAAPESQWERSVRHPLTSDLCDPNLSIWGLSRKFRQAGRLHSTRAGRCPWGTAREHRCQVCELPGWRRQQGDGHRLPRRGEPGGLHGRRDRAGWPGCEGRRGCPVRKRLKSQGEARVATACLDRACPSRDTEGGWGLRGPRGRS